MKPSVILFNPRSNRYKPRIPNSVLQVAASLEGQCEYVMVDGNLENDPWSTIRSYANEGRFLHLGVTVMPGPQLQEAALISGLTRKHFPQIKITWGGYFPSNHPKTVLDSGYVDFVINGMGDRAFPALIDAIHYGKAFENIPNLIFKEGNKIITSARDAIYDPDELPELPYSRLNEFYSIKKYLGKTYLGSKTIAYHSSFGCPFTCSFCAVVPIYNARWKGKSASKIYRDIKYLKENFGGNAIEFHDNNFFVSEKRTVEFAVLIKPEKMVWWGEGRIDTLDKYSDSSLALMRESGCKMIFFGAESGNDDVLRQMDKGGTQNAEQILRFAERMKKFDIIPEYSFVLGTPAATEEKVWKQIHDDIDFIRKVKEVNPDAEIIIYIYSPVPTEGSELYAEAVKNGFKFPSVLEEWLEPRWLNFDLRKNPLTPWLTPGMIDHIKNFETVINGKFPTVSDYKLKKIHRNIYAALSGWRYRNAIYKYPVEIKLANRLFRYRQPEKEGF